MSEDQNKKESDELEDIMDSISDKHDVTINSSEDKLVNSDSDEKGELIAKIMDQFDIVQTEIWKTMMADRKLLDKYIDIFTNKVSDDNVKNVYVESLTSLLNTKASTSMNATKLLDSIAKMTSALKNVEKSSNSIDLADLLSDIDDSDNSDANVTGP